MPSPPLLPRLESESADRAQARSALQEARNWPELFAAAEVALGPERLAWGDDQIASALAFRLWQQGDMLVVLRPSAEEGAPSSPEARLRLSRAFETARDFALALVQPLSQLHGSGQALTQRLEDYFLTHAASDVAEAFGASFVKAMTPTLRRLCAKDADRQRVLEEWQAHAYDKAPSDVQPESPLPVSMENWVRLANLGGFDEIRVGPKGGWPNIEKGRSAFADALQHLEQQGAPFGAFSFAHSKLCLNSQPVWHSESAAPAAFCAYHPSDETRMRFVWRTHVSTEMVIHEWTHGWDALLSKTNDEALRKPLEALKEVVARGARDDEAVEQLPGGVGDGGRSWAKDLIDDWLRFRAHPHIRERMKERNAVPDDLWEAFYDALQGAASGGGEPILHILYDLMESWRDPTQRALDREGLSETVQRFMVEQEAGRVERRAARLGASAYALASVRHDLKQGWERWGCNEVKEEPFRSLVERERYWSTPEEMLARAAERSLTADPSALNKGVHESAYPHGVELDRIRAAFRSFFAQVLPRLKELQPSRPSAVVGPLVEEGLAEVDRPCDPPRRRPRP